MAYRDVEIKMVYDMERLEMTFHIGHRRPGQCQRCGCYDFVRTHVVRTPDQWDLECNGGPHPDNTTFILTGNEPRAFTCDFPTLLTELMKEIPE